MSVPAEMIDTRGPTSEQLSDFYTHYYETLDEGRMKEWPDFFSDECSYRVIPRENYENGYALCTMQADNKGMVTDRVQGILRTQVFGPRYCRRFFSGLRVVSVEGDVINVRQNVLAVQTLIDRTSTILLCGVAYDKLVIESGRLLFKQRDVVSDSELIDSSLIYPI